MSTYITVTSGTGALVNRVKQVQQANREAQQQREQDARTVAAVSAQTQATEITAPVGGLPNTQVDRRPAAQRQAGGFGLLFYCTYIDAPGSIWSDGTTLNSYVSYNPSNVTAQLLADATNPTLLEEIDVPVPAYTSAAWYNFNARSPMTDGVLKRPYLPYTGKENGSVNFRYGYGGIRLSIPTSGTTSLNTVISPKFESIYSDSLLLNRFPFHVYPEIHSAIVVGFGISDGSQTVTVYNGGPTIPIGAQIRIAPEWTNNSTDRSWISINLIPKLETDYTVTDVSVGASTTVYKLNTLIYDGAASGIPARLYRSYPSWSAVPISEVRWRWSDSVLAKDLQAGGWNDSNSFDYSSGVDAEQAKAGSAWTYVDARRVQIPPLFEDIIAYGSGLTVPYPTSEAFSIGSNDTWVVRQGVYTFTGNADRLLAKSNYGPYTFNPDLAPDIGYEPKSGPWTIQNTTSDYEAELFTVLLRQGDFPNYQFYPVEIPFASLAPLLSPGFGNSWPPSVTPEFRQQDPPGTYQTLLVRIIG